MYLVYTFSVNWVVSIIITFLVYVFAKHREIKLHALQATIFGLCAIIFMSIFGFICGLFLPKYSTHILSVTGKLIGVVFAILALLVILQRDVKLKVIEEYV